MAAETETGGSGSVVVDMHGAEAWGKALRDWAVFYMEHFGWAVVPCWMAESGGGADKCACPEGENCPWPGKHLVDGIVAVKWGDGGRVAARGAVDRVWAADRVEVKERRWGLAILAGSDSGVLVWDMPAGAEMPAGWLGGGGSLVAMTPSGGRHWFFRLGAGESVGAVAAGPDGTGLLGVGGGGSILADGSYVIVYPRTGYKWEGGPAAVKAGTAGLSDVPKGMRQRLSEIGVLVAPGVGTHENDPWRCLAGAKLAGSVTRTYNRIGDVRRFVDNWGHLVRWDAAAGRWAVWTARGWTFKEEAENEIMRYCTDDMIQAVLAEARVARADGRDRDADLGSRRAVLMATLASGRLLTDMRADPRVQMGGRGWDQDGALLGLPVVDGVGRAIDLRTGEVVVGAREKLISRTAGASVAGLRDRGAWDESKAFRKYLLGLEEAHGADFVRLLKRAAGMTLFGAGAVEAASGGRVSSDVIFVLGGAPRSGKSTFVEAMSAAMGDYARPMNPVLLFGSKGNPEFSVAGVRGARMLHMSEPPEGEKLNVPLLKGLSGGDSMTGRGAYEKSEVSFSPDATMWIATNHPLEHSDEALWERLKIFEFRSDWSRGRGEAWIREAMKKDGRERAAFLWWAVEGALELVREGWGGTGEWDRAVRAVKIEIDSEMRFLVERVVVTGNEQDRIKLGALLVEYNNWVLYEGDVGKKKKSGSMIKLELGYKLAGYGGKRVGDSDMYSGVRLV